MSDSSLIVKKVREEIDSFSTSRQQTKKLLFEKTSPELLSNLQKFLDSIFEDSDLSNMDIEDFKSKLFSSLRWELYDH